MQRHRGKMFRSRPYATALDDFDFFLSFPTLLKFKKKRCSWRWCLAWALMWSTVYLGCNSIVECWCVVGFAHLAAKMCDTTRDWCSFFLLMKFTYDAATRKFAWKNVKINVTVCSWKSGDITNTDCECKRLWCCAPGGKNVRDHARPTTEWWDLDTQNTEHTTNNQ